MAASEFANEKGRKKTTTALTSYVALLANATGDLGQTRQALNPNSKCPTNIPIQSFLKSIVLVGMMNTFEVAAVTIDL